MKTMRGKEIVVRVARVSRNDTVSRVFPSEFSDYAYCVMG